MCRRFSRVFLAITARDRIRARQGEIAVRNVARGRRLP
jgi:hypothetical protein